MSSSMVHVPSCRAVCVAAFTLAVSSAFATPSVTTTDGSLKVKVDAGKSVLFTVGSNTVNLEGFATKNGVAREQATLRAALQESIQELIANTSSDTRAADQAALDAESKNLRASIASLAKTTVASVQDAKKDVAALAAAAKAAQDKKLKDTETALDAANKKIKAMEEIVNQTAAVIKKHSQPRTVAVYTTGAQVIGPLKGAQYFNGNKWQLVKDRSWKIPGKGRYLLSATLRTIHKDGQSGFTKLYVKQKNGASVPSSVRMCSEYRSAVGFGETNKNAQFFWMIDAPKEVEYVMMGWKNCQDNKCGLINDKDALEEMTFIHLPPGAGWTKRIVGPEHGRRTSQGRRWTNFNVGLRFGTTWLMEGAGTYLLFYTGRTYQANNGFLKHRLVDSRQGRIAGSDRMVTEYQGKSGFSFVNHAASFVWLFKKTNAAFSNMRTQTYATSTSIGWQNDSNGYAETSYFKVSDPRNVFQKIIRGGGRINFATGGKWTSLKNYEWDLPAAGTYTLFVTLRTYTAAAGWGKVKLGVVANDDAKKAKLLIGDHEKIKYGKSERMMVYWKAKRFSFSNHVATFTWQVQVTGKLKIILQGSASAGNIGVQNDGNGYASCIWLKTTGVEKGLLA